MVGFYFFIKDLILPIRSTGLLGSVLYFFRSAIPAQPAKWIFSSVFTGLTKPVCGKEMAYRFGFQGKPQDKFSLYDGKAIPESWNPEAFEHDFIHSKCSYSRGNCLLLPALLLLAVRGFFPSLPVVQEAGIFVICVDLIRYETPSRLANERVVWI